MAKKTLETLREYDPYQPRSLETEKQRTERKERERKERELQDIRARARQRALDMERSGDLF